MKISELITEISMKPKILKGFLDSEFAQDVTMGFECELIVPELEDLHGHNTGVDKSKDIPFPTGPDWKAKAFAWLVGGNDSPNYAVDFEKFIGPEFEEWMLSDNITVNWISVAQLKKFNGAYIMGGGRNECLREVELLMNAFNIKYKRIDSLVYG